MGYIPPNAYWLRPNGIPATCALMAHMDGAHLSTTFTDSSATTKTITARGAAKQTNANQWLSGTNSGILSGAGDYLQITNHADFNLSTATSWMFDLLIRPSSVAAGYQCIFSQTGTGSVSPFQIFQYGTSLYLYCMSNSSTYIVNTGIFGVLAANVWTRIFVGFTGSSYIAGQDSVVKFGAPSTTKIYAPTEDIFIGQRGSAWPFVGQLAEARLLKNECQYGTYPALTAPYDGGPIR